MGDTMNLLTRADDSETQKDPMSFAPFFFSAFAFILWKIKVKQIQSPGGDIFHPSLNKTTEEFASELSQQCHYIQGWEIEVLG